MTNHAVSNRSHHAFHHVVGIAALLLALGSLPRAVFAQAATSVAGIKIGIIGSGNLGGTLGTLWCAVRFYYTRIQTSPMLNLRPWLST